MKEEAYTMIGLSQATKKKLKQLALENDMTLYDYINWLVGQVK